MSRQATLLSILLAAALGAAATAQGDHINARDIITVLPPDAIPAVTEPTFDDDPGWLPDEARVIGVAIADDARAYPLAILNWHEIVDDVVGGRPLAITFCPLCGTGIVFDREMGGEVLVFKVSGKLYKNDLLMYDTQTESLWLQIIGHAVLGEYIGTDLRLVTAATLSWAEWRAMHPQTWLLDRPRDANGSFLRDYDENPYEGYNTSPGTRFRVENIDPYKVLHPKEPVLGLFVNKEARAYPQSVLVERKVANDLLGGAAVLVTYAREVMKAWERGNRTFVASAESTVMDEAGRTYDAISGAGADGALVEIPGVTAFWFAWYDFYPMTTIYGYFGVGEEAAPSLPVDPLVLGAFASVALGVAVVVIWRRRRHRT